MINLSIILYWTVCSLVFLVVLICNLTMLWAGVFISETNIILYSRINILYLKSWRFASKRSSAEAWQTTSLPLGRTFIDLSQKVCVMLSSPREVKNCSAVLEIKQEIRNIINICFILCKHIVLPH